MADEDKAPEPHVQSTQSSEAAAETTPELPPPQNDPPAQVAPTPEDRTELIQRARAFLTSPQVRHENLAAKQRFLREKGLTEAEIENLLREVPAPPPLLPPKTYPQPPPSRLPYLLLNVFRALSWIAGGSAAILLAYFRFVYPRIAQTYQARLSLRTHNKALLERLTQSLEDLKTSQRSTFAVLPRPEPFREPTRYRGCRNLTQLAEASKGEKDIPPITLLRCAIQECSKGTQKATSAELFRLLEEKFPWVSEEGAQVEETLWQTLTTTPLFQPAPLPPASTTGAAAPPPPVPSPDTVWTYTPPTPPAPAPLLTSLTTLASALPARTTASAEPPQPKFQHTFQALSDLTGYIAAQTYASGFGGVRAPAFGLGLGSGAPLAPAEEEVRREIRALKGLVLNRRSFMPRVPSASALAAAPAAVRSPDPGAGAAAVAGAA
ncbi:hypothetical protein C8Q77DRAFT_1048683 [Trametes polyzona]|nr:hypothetical protein C8Q77DRAFT_1048683 [Trametes polyzona]